MKKVLIVLLVLLMLAGVAGAVYFYIQYNTASKEKDTLVQQNGELQNAIDAIGPVSYVYTVRAEVKGGQEIRADDLVQQSMPVSSINDNFILDIDSIVGKFYKIGMKPGASITKDVVMEDAMTEVMYERDLVFDYLPLGINIGDYVDIRITLPYGEEFIVIGHERVYQIVHSTNTVKVKLNEAQLALWTSAITDKALYKSKGLALYVTKYVEPGIQVDVMPFYPVRNEMEKVVTLNPNIPNKKVCINALLRTEIDKMLGKVTDEDGGLLSGGRGEESASMNTSKEVYVPNKKDGSASTGTNVPNGNDTSGDLDQLEDVGDSIQMDIGTDVDGNASTVTPDEVVNADGENVGISDEDAIE